MRSTAALMMLLVLPLACRRIEPGRADFERMREQPHYRPYDPILGTRDQSSMRTPPSGTVSRTEYTLGSAVATGTGVSGVPITITPDLLAHGAQLFNIYCAVCHGAAGNGESVVGANMRPVRPPSLLTASARANSGGQLFEIVTHGRGNMPRYSWALAPEERWAVVAHVRKLQGLP